MAAAASISRRRHQQQQPEAADEGKEEGAPLLQGLAERLATLVLHPSGQPRPTAPSSTTPLPRAQERRFAAALAAVDDEIVGLGCPTGGWNARDHATFLKLWRSHRATPVAAGGGRDGGVGVVDPVARVAGNLRLLDRAAVVLRDKRFVVRVG